MSQTYSIVPRKNLVKPDEAPRYYAVARSGKTVSVKEIVKRIAERSSYSRGELQGCITEYLIEVLNVLEEGNIAQLGDLGNFRLTILTAKSTATAAEFKASCIEGGHVVFYPGKELRKLCKGMEYTTHKSKDDADDDGDDTPTPPDKPSGGGDDGETPDPAA